MTGNLKYFHRLIQRQKKVNTAEVIDHFDSLTSSHVKHPHKCGSLNTMPLNRIADNERYDSLLELLRTAESCDNTCSKKGYVN